MFTKLIMVSKKENDGIENQSSFGKSLEELDHPNLISNSSASETTM